MRTAIVALLALVAIAAAGMWGLAQFGGPKPMVAEEHVPVAKVAAKVATVPASSAAPLAPAAQHEPGAAHPNISDTLKTEKPKPDVVKPDAATPGAADKVAEAAPAPAPAVAPAAPAPAEARPSDPLKAAAKRMVEEKLKSVVPPTAPSAGSPAPAAPLAPGFASPPSTVPDEPPPPVAVNAPPPVAAPAPPPVATPAPPAPDLVQTASAPAAPAAPVSLADQFKTRKVAYNRPPSTLYLDRPIDISLVIDATAAADPAAQLQGFPGQVVERDVSLSNSVSARLTGVGFDIVSQNPDADRQVLSASTPNRWQWRVTPTEPGAHTLMLDIFGYKTNSLDAEPLDAYRDQITVEVRQLDSVIRWAKSIQPVFAVIAAIAGLMSALIAVLRFRRDGKKSG